MKLFNQNIRNIGKTLAMVSCLTLTSCNFLDIVPPEQASLEDATKNAEKTMNFMLSCYANVWNPLTPNATDEHVWPAGWGGPHRYLSYGLQTPAAPYDNGRWAAFYRSINQCWLFMREVENARGCTEDQIAQWKAEVYFLLAYYHYELLAYYGPIPIVDHYFDTNTTSDDMGGRMHYDYVVDWIVDMLDNKVINCPQLPITRSADERGRATTVIAKALKARVLLYAASPLWNGEFPYSSWTNEVETPGYGKELVSKTYSREKWERAKTACDEALRAALDAGYKLYDDLEYSTETLGIKDSELPYIPGLNLSDTENKEFQKRVLMLRNMMTLKVREGNTELIWGLANNEGIQGYTMPLHIIQNNNGSWYNETSAISPTLYSVEHFYTEDGNLPEFAAGKNGFPAESDWLKSANLGTIDGKDRNDIIQINLKREPRYYAWVAYNGGDYGVRLSNGVPVLLKLRSATDQGYNTEYGSSNYCTTGFLNQKWIRVDQSRNKNSQWTPANPHQFARPIIRMAELYLNLAECCAALSESESDPLTQDALDNLNFVRARAGIRDITTSDLANMPLMDWVRNERFVELWSEGHRLTDVRRWCKGEEYFGPGKREGLNAVKVNPSFEEFNTRIEVNQPYKWYTRMYMSPLQDIEVQANRKLVQAPGY